MLIILVPVSCICYAGNYVTDGFGKNPYRYHVDRACASLTSTSTVKRAKALETLGFLRSFDAADALITCLNDPVPTVRREAVMTLGWTASRRHLNALAAALSDPDWTVRQCAWIALQNCTGMTFPFDSLAELHTQKPYITRWREWIAHLSSNAVPEDLIQLLARESFHDRERAARAIGVLGGENAVNLLLPHASKYIQRRTRSREEKLYVQACIRALGRLGGAESHTMLIALLTNVQWACYAAEALGDTGGENAAMALIAAYPDYAIGFNRSGHRDNYGTLVKRLDPNDSPGLSCVDRIPRTSYAILLSLARIGCTSDSSRRALRDIAPLLVANMPNDFDATVVYEIEPWQMLTAYLLEKSGLRQATVDAAFNVLGLPRDPADAVLCGKELLDLADDNLDQTQVRYAPYAGGILASLCRSTNDIPLLISLLQHTNGWIKIGVAKALMFLEADEAVMPLISLLSAARDDDAYGCSADFFRFYNLDAGDGYDEYNDPCPRYKEAYIRALGRLGNPAAVPLLRQFLTNEHNTLEVQYAAALALSELATPDALAGLAAAENCHPYHSVCLVAREALWINGITPETRTEAKTVSPWSSATVTMGMQKAIVFIQGEHDPGNAYQIPRTFQAYTTSDSGPTYRLGRNIRVLSPPDPEGTLTDLTLFTNGYVADIDVSYDGKSILFSRRASTNDPWWHVYEINADGSGLRQITDGPYHDVQPAYMPDGRIVFSTSRIGVRDEYHGYLATGLAVMNADGSDIHCIGFNLGRDSEPCIDNDGKILFTRLELFYSRLKTEWNLLSVFPDGTKIQTLYGPERRDFWYKTIIGGDAQQPPRHRVLRIAQPQPYDASHYCINSFSGPMIVGPGRFSERILQKDNTMAITTPYPLDNTTLLCAAGSRPLLRFKDGTVMTNKSGQGIYNTNAAVDYGLYYMDTRDGTLTLLYNDPDTSEFEARPLQPRAAPKILTETTAAVQDGYSATFFCDSVYTTQEPLVHRGRYIRVVEGLPTVARHQTHKNGGIAWRNHGGATGRVLGTVPLAPDGSFHVEIPADRLIHFQVLDSDRRVVGNELIWQYARPGEAKGCLGCHENPGTARSTAGRFSRASALAPLPCLPGSESFIYRAKVWFKGYLPEEREERVRTVNAINLIGRL